MNSNSTIAFHTLGCKLNFSETSTLARQLEQAGFARKEFEDRADIYVINTCSVTENANRECRSIVRKIRRKSPGSTVVITGCYAQLKPEEIASIPGVDLVLGAAEKFNLLNQLKELNKSEGARICSCDVEEVSDFHSSYSLNDRTRSFLKVQDGCDYNCSFCTIPLARGKSRSDSINHVLEQVQKLADRGIQEIVLTGVNLGDFGTQNPEPAEREKEKNKEDFFQLITALDKLSCISRFRISSIEPNLLSNDIIAFVANSRSFMPHFHIPLQSASNRILGMMRRRYKKELYAERVQLIKTLMPHCAIGADVIVGFPGETDDDFNETVEFIKNLDISYLHVFTYSERDHTKALEIKPVISQSLRQERNRILRNLSYQKARFFNARHAGQTRKVLFEGHNSGDTMDGYSDNYIKVTTSLNPALVNQIVDWTL